MAAATPVEPSQTLKPALEVYPVPAADFVVVRVMVVPEGAELRVKFFNAASHLALQDVLQVRDGGIREIAVPVSKLSRGAYLVVVEGISTGGGPGLLDGSRRAGSLKGKALIRR